MIQARRPSQLQQQQQQQQWSGHRVEGGTVSGSFSSDDPRLQSSKIQGERAPQQQQWKWKNRGEEDGTTSGSFSSSGRGQWHSNNTQGRRAVTTTSAVDYSVVSKSISDRKIELGQSYFCDARK